MARIGTTENPLKNDEGHTLAQGMLDDVFLTEAKKRGLWWWQGNFWVWEEMKRVWKLVDPEEMRMGILRWAMGRQVMHNEDPTVVEGLVVTRYLVEEVLFALKALAAAKWQQSPVWVDSRGKEEMDADYCVGFEDVVVCVKGGEVKTTPRDELWFDPVILPVRYSPEAKCERWERAVTQWSDGDENWVKLLQRWVGYLLVSQRGYRKLMLLEGVTAGGKGVICHVVKALVGQGFFNTECDTLAGDFSLNGLQHARVCSITEMSRMDYGSGQKVARVIKNLVGGDPLTINEKYEKQLRNVVSRAAVMMSSNQIPKLPNESQGLSAKMLVLPFTVSFDKKGAEYGLKERLVREELEGIAAWAMRGLVDLEKAGQEDRWPKPEKAAEVEMHFRVLNNPLAAFLESRFIENPDGWVPSHLIRQEWRKFLKISGVKAPPILENQLTLKLVQEGGWTLEAGKKAQKGVSGGVRGIKGMVLRMDVKEDL